MPTKTTAIIGAVMLMATLMSACIDSNETVAETNTSVTPTPTPTPTIEPDPVVKEISNASPQAYIDKAYADGVDYQGILYKYTVSSKWRSADGSDITGVDRKNGVYASSYNYDKWNRTVDWEMWMNGAGIPSIGIYDRTETEYPLVTGEIKTVITLKARQEPGGDYLYVMIDCVRERRSASASAPMQTPSPTPVATTPDKEYQPGEYTTIVMSLSVTAEVYENGMKVDTITKKQDIDIPCTPENWDREVVAVGFAHMTGLGYAGVEETNRIEEHFLAEKRGSVSGRWDTDGGHVTFVGRYSLIKK